MSLRSRVILLIGVVLVLSLVLGTLMAGYQAKRALRAELQSGMVGAEQTVHGAIENPPPIASDDHRLRDLISTFDGNRHVRAQLISTRGDVLVRSAMPDRVRPAPQWFATLLGNPHQPVRIAIPRAAANLCCIVLSPVAEQDVAAMWAEFSAVVVALSTASAFGLVLVYLAIGAALRPLEELSDAFGRIGTGEYGGRVSERGPPELLRIERDFNGMSSRLAAMRDRNAALESQLLTLQDEERADLARDLHDEIGPHLFAVNVDAEMIGQHAVEGRNKAIADQVRSIQASVKHMQARIRDILSRLRPSKPTELGFSAAIKDLVEFWRKRRPDVEFELTMAPPDLDISETIEEVSYRVVQEGLSNSIRHAAPSRIAVLISAALGARLLIEVRNDGSPSDRPHRPGLGLIGMRERVTSVGGDLLVETNGTEWVVRAQLPIPECVSTPSTAVA